MVSNMKESLNTYVYYDKNCPMCTVFADTVSTKGNNQIIVDANEVDSEASPASRKELLNEIHIVESDGKIRTGPDAVLTSLGNIYPILKPFAILARLPILSWLSRQVYFFISKRRVLWYGGNVARLYWLFLIVNLGLLAAILLSLPAWFTERTYPLVPLLSGLEWLQPYTWLITTGLILSLVISLVRINNFKVNTIISLLFLTPLVLLDVSRLQPWVFHYSAILFLLSWSNLLLTIRTGQILDAARFIVVGIYFWSGIQKMNTGFLLEVFPWFTKPLWSPLGDTGTYMALVLGMFVPFIESAFALGLLTRRFRMISIIGSGAMLGLVTISIMFGHGWNSVVWPWNFAIFSMVLVLFYNYEDTISDLFKRTTKNLLGIFAVCLFVLMPVGNFFGLVDHYLSWSLYSGHVPIASISASRDTLDELVDETIITKTEIDGVSSVKMHHWSLQSINFVPYPEERVFIEIFSSLCKKFPDPNLSLNIETTPIFLSHKKEHLIYDCSFVFESKVID